MINVQATAMVCASSLLLISLGVGCGGESPDLKAPPSDGGSRSDLQARQVDLPKLSLPRGYVMGGQCTANKQTEVGVLGLEGVPGEGALGPSSGMKALKAGPVYARVEGGPPRVTFSDPRHIETDWISRDSYRGPLLVRGARIDSPGRLRFGSTKNPRTALYLPAGSGRPWGALAGMIPRAWRAAAVPISVRRPGCYAVQIDGFGFSYTLSFGVQ